MNKTIFFWLMLLTIAATSCKHEPQDLAIATDDSTATEDCSTDTVYFKNTIQPIITASCAYSGCHDAATAEDGVILDTYTNIIQTGDVKAGRPEDSKLYKVLIENDPDDIMPPPPGSPLSSVQINDIYQWIMQGAKNNECLGCDSINVTFSGSILPIMQTICQTCHSGSAPLGNLSLVTYDDVSAVAMTGQLVGAVTHADGYFTMPDKDDSTKYIPNCKIKQIIKWVNDGYPDN